MVRRLLIGLPLLGMGIACLPIIETDPMFGMFLAPGLILSGLSALCKDDE